MIDYTILVPRCQAFYSKIFLYFPFSQFFPFGFPERRCWRRLPTQTQKRASRSLHTSNTAAQQASRSLKSRSAGGQQTPLAVLAARGLLFPPPAPGGPPPLRRSPPQAPGPPPGPENLFPSPHPPPPPPPPPPLPPARPTATPPQGDFRPPPVILAFCCSSGMVSAPQLHMVDLTLLSVRFTLSFRLPA